MRIIEENKFNILIADDNKKIRSIDDVFVEGHYEEDVFVEDYHPYYSKTIYLPKGIDTSKINDLYVEEDD